MASFNKFLFQKAMLFILDAFRSFSNALFPLFRVIGSSAFRLRSSFSNDSDFQFELFESNPDCSVIAESNKSGEGDEDCYSDSEDVRYEEVEDEHESEEGVVSSLEGDHDHPESSKDRIDAEEDMESKSFLSFRFQTYDEFINRVQFKNDDSVVDESDTESSDSIQNYEPDGLELGFEKEDLEEDDISVSSGSDTASATSSSKFSFRSSFLDSVSDDGFLSDPDFISMEFSGSKVEEDEGSLIELKNFEGEDKKSGSDSEDSGGLESLWEHQDLVEQLKMEIRKVRASELPTILEESECVKIMDDLKPLKIEDKFQHEGTIHEVHKFYKSYRDRMRKFDIFSYQKMYAIGFLRLKDPLETFSISKTPFSMIATIVGQDCWPCGSKTTLEKYPMIKFTRDLESDLEVVYVGQLCLSWEFLRWEYDKALELWDSDPYRILHFNEIAGEFQQFQVLLQRFLEDEAFQGPRVQNYVKNRCVHRNLLQVPVIREDKFKDRKREKKKGDAKDAITSMMLVEIIEECIRLFWQFVRADKDANMTLFKCCRRAYHSQLQNLADVELLLEVQSNLRKKHKKLKQLVRSDSSRMLRVLQKHRGSEDRAVYFFCEVDFKLVSRVLALSKLTTDQLLWCRSKLDKVKFVHKALHVEPSFLLFPCS